MREKLVENRILQNKDFHQAYYYSRDIIKGIWPEAETFIMKDPRYAYLYSKEVIKGRWYEAEPFILKNIQYAYFYATDVIKGRWIDLETKLFEKKYEDIAYNYCENFWIGCNHFNPLWLKYHTNENVIINYFR